MKRLVFIAFTIYGLSSVSVNENKQITTPVTNNKLCDLSMRGKHLLYKNKTPYVVSYIIIKENGNNIRSFIIEKLTPERWITIYEGSKIGKNCKINLNEPCNSHLRLKVLKSYHIPHLSSFQIYANRL